MITRLGKIAIFRCFRDNYRMSHYFTSQILVLALLVPVVTRFLFTRSARIDTIVLFSPFAFLVSILNLFIYGISMENLLLVAITVFVGLINFRAQLRLLSGLVVDYYRGPFILGCVVSWIFIAGAAALIVWFCPIADSKLSVKGKLAESITIEKKVYTGTAYGGLQEKTDYFSAPAAVVHSVAPKENAAGSVILYLPGICTRSADFLPAMNVLAEQGYRVLSADFSVKDIPYTGRWYDAAWCRDFTMRALRMRHAEEYAAKVEMFNEKKGQEAELLVSLAKQQYPDAEFVLVYDREAKKQIEWAVPDVKHIQIDLDGCALLALTNPLEAQLMDGERWNRSKRREFKDLPSQIAWYIINCLG